MSLKHFFRIVILLLAAHNAQAQWTLADTVSNGNFRSLHFITTDRGCIVGELQGRVRNTQNGTATLQDFSTPFNSEIFMDVQMLDPQNGYACGGSWFGQHHNVLIRTADGGQTWTTANADSTPGYAFERMDFRNLDTGILSGGYQMYKTFDGGTTITPVNSPSVNYTLNDLRLLPGNRIILSGTIFPMQTFIAVSTDWGANWNTVFTDTTLGISSLDFQGASGIASCSKGWILRTADAGQTWTKQHITADSFHFTRVRIYNNSVAWLAGYKQYDGYLYVTKDGGNTWQQNLVVPNETLVDISMPTLDTGYALGYRKLYKTTNSGGLHLSVTELPQQTQRITIWPNPATNTVHIELPAGVKLQQATVSDMHGRIVRCYNASNTTLELNGLAKGCYLLEVKTDKGRQTEKLVVE